MQPRTICATLSLATILTLGPSVFAATGVVVPPGPTGKNGNNMAKGQEQKDQIMRYYGSQEVNFYNKKRTMAIFTQLDGTRPMKTVVGGKDPKDPDADIQTTVDKLQKGDVVKMTLAPWNGVMAINYIKKVDVKPAEENPHGFIFQEFYNEQGSGAPIIRVTKYGESYELTIQNVKDDKGKMAPDPALMDDVQKFKMGDAVYIDATPTRPPAITEIFPYKDPQTGKVTKVAQTDVEGSTGKTSSVDIETSDGKTITALVPGKVTNKRFVADAVLMRDVHQMKPGTEVQYLTRDDNGKTYLVELTRAPKTAAKTGATPSDNMTNTGKSK
jgi:hypothetical protein